MFSLNEIKKLENESISSLSGYIPRISNKEYKLDLNKKEYEKLRVERATLKREIARCQNSFDKQIKMNKVNDIDMKVIKLNKERERIYRISDDKIAPLYLENTKYFNNLVQFAMSNIAKDGRFSPTVTKIKNELLDHVMKDYMETIFETLFENRNNMKVRENLSDVVNFFFSPSGKGYYLMENFNYAKEENYKNQRRCVNWYKLLQCCNNPEWSFKGSKIEKYFESEVQRMKNLLNNNSKNIY